MKRQLDNKNNFQERIVTGIRQGGSIVLTLTGIIEEGVSYRVQKVTLPAKNESVIVITKSKPGDEILSLIEKELKS